MSVQIKGREYTTVAERVAAVHQAGKPFEIIESHPFQAADAWVWRATVRVDELQYTGNAIVHLDARPGSADATDPWACAETSAIGRCLGFAGYGSSGSIASADELRQVNRG